MQQSKLDHVLLPRSSKMLTFMSYQRHINKLCTRIAPNGAHHKWQCENHHCFCIKARSLGLEEIPNLSTAQHLKPRKIGIWSPDFDSIVQHLCYTFFPGSCYSFSPGKPFVTDPKVLPCRLLGSELILDHLCFAGVTVVFLYFRIRNIIVST